jgi:uncharacterized protein YodC (DUF2158 family)
MEFKVGDLVKLKSGGPVMTVADVDDDELTCVGPARGFVAFDRIGDRGQFPFFFGILRASHQRVGARDEKCVHSVG